MKFAGHTPQLYAPARVFAGEKDDFDPADRCVQLAESFRARGSDFVVTVYPDAMGGFDITPPDTNYPLPDRTAMHPGGVTVSTHPQYDPWATNLVNCTITLKSVFDTVNPSGLAGCTRRGAHFQENAETAAQLQNDLKRELNVLLSE